MRRRFQADYARVWENLEIFLPDHFRTARERRQAAERLGGELLAGPAEKWPVRLSDRRYRSPDLLEHLLEVCHGFLPFEPRRGLEVTEVALKLGGLLSEEDSENQDIAEPLCRANCLGGHASRLLGDHQEAEVCLERAAFLAHNPLARGFFLRAVGLLRWDQGRMDEAEALLHQAGRCYYEVEDTKEGAACFALLGLLYIEEDELARAEQLLRTARRGLDAQSHPWLAAEAYLALARCLALGRQRPEACAVRETAWSLATSVPPQAISVGWRDAQVAEALGDVAGAEALFRSARQRYIEAGSLPEASLTTVQLAKLLLRLGRAEETGELTADLIRAFDGRPGLELSLAMLQGLQREAAVSAEREEENWHVMPPTLLLSFRHHRIYPQPVPFV